MLLLHRHHVAGAVEVPGGIDRFRGGLAAQPIGRKIDLARVEEGDARGAVGDQVAIGKAQVIDEHQKAPLLGTKVFKLDQKTVLLIGVGSSICGAAAVMATESIVRARTEQVTVAVSTVIVFGTLALFLYPAMYYFNEQWQLLSLSPITSGIYIGATVHEVAQVAAAASSISAEAANTAVITKMVRVMMLGPFLLILSVYLSRRQLRETINMVGRRDPHKTARIVIPWFVLGFSAVIALNSLAILPGAIVSGITQIDTFLLAMAMVALGLSSHISTIRRAGIMPLLFATSLFVWLIFGGLAITMGVTTWLG